MTSELCRKIQISKTAFSEIWKEKIDAEKNFDLLRNQIFVKHQKEDKIEAVRHTLRAAFTKTIQITVTTRHP